MMHASCYRPGLEYITNSNLQDNFADTGLQYGPGVFYMWLNGNITREGFV